MGIFILGVFVGVFFWVFFCQFQKIGVFCLVLFWVFFVGVFIVFLGVFFQKLKKHLPDYYWLKVPRGSLGPQYPALDCKKGPLGSYRLYGFHNKNKWRKTNHLFLDAVQDGKVVGLWNP